MPMADVSFTQPERRNLALPIVVALLVLGLAGFLLFHYTPHQTADVEVTQVDLVPTHVVFKSETNVVGSDQSIDTLYVLATVRITDRLRLPLFLKDMTATLTTADGSAGIATSAVERGDLLNLYTSFPAVKKIAAAEPVSPLLRESRINPGQTVEGFVVLHFPITPDLWQNRRDAVLTIDLYHQGSLSVSLPKASPAAAFNPAGQPSR